MEGRPIRGGVLNGAHDVLTLGLHPPARIVLIVNDGEFYWNILDFGGQPVPVRKQ